MDPVMQTKFLNALESVAREIAELRKEVSEIRNQLDALNTNIKVR